MSYPESGSFPDGRQPWEPGSAEDFRNRDPLNPGRNDWGKTLERFYHHEVEFAAWSRLSAPLRTQAWREREISGFVRRQCTAQRWDEQEAVQGLASMGVGRRPWELAGVPGMRVALGRYGKRGQRIGGYLNALCEGNFRNASSQLDRLGEDDRLWLEQDPLSIVLRFQPPMPPAAEMLARLQLAPYVNVDTQIFPTDSFGIDERVPVVFEASRDFQPRQSQTGQPVSAASTNAYLQPGESIDTRPSVGTFSGQAVKGTLAALAEYTSGGQTCNGLVGAWHVLGDIGDPVYWHGSQVASVVYAEPNLDISLAELNGAWPCKREVLSRGLDPAAPIQPFCGMPVEYCGAGSGTTQEAYIGLMYTDPPGFYNLGTVAAFEVEGASAGGDSGALLLSGHNGQDASSPNLAIYRPSLPQTDLSALVGVLVAGAASLQGCIHPATIAAISIPDIESVLRNQGYFIRWFTR